MPRASRRLRIVHYLNFVHIAEGGVVRAVLDLCATLADRGHEVTLVTLDGKDAPSEWPRRGDKRAHAASTRLPTVVEIDTRFRFGDELRSNLADAHLLHVHGPWDLYNVWAARIARQLGRPYVLTVHGMLDQWSMAQKPLKKRIYHAVAAKRLLDGAALIHCTAQMELDQAKEWFAGQHGAVVPCLLNFAPFRTLPGKAAAQKRFAFLDAGHLKLLFLSRLHHKKGPAVLIEAAGILKARGLAFTLVMAGPGSSDYIAQLAGRVASLGLERQTHFVGLVTDTDKLSLFQACDLFVLPTSQENFGLVLTESMACATPVLTTRGTAIWREIETGGGVVRDASPCEIADAITELAADRRALALRGRASREWVMRFFDPEQILDGYEALYGKALSKANAWGAVPGKLVTESVGLRQVLGRAAPESARGT